MGTYTSIDISEIWKNPKNGKFGEKCKNWENDKFGEKAQFEKKAKFWKNAKIEKKAKTPTLEESNKKGTRLCN